MAISISNYPVYLQDGLKLDRDCLKSQESQNEGRKVFDRDSLEVSPLSKNREILMDRIKQSAASLSDMRAGILKEIREEKRAVCLFRCSECLWIELCKALC